MLTPKERKDFHDGINDMKRSMVEGNTNEYDVFVMYHQTAVSPAAHFGPSFLGWHREFLMRYCKINIFLFFFRIPLL